MITDPAATPSHKTARILWAFSIGVLAFWLQAYHFMNATPLWALFFLSPLTPFLDYFFKGKKFEWVPGKRNHMAAALPGIKEAVE